MPRKIYTPEQIIRKIREAEVLIAKGMAAQQAARQIGVSEQTYYRWRKEYGGMQVEQAKRLKVLEKENIRLKRLVAEKELDIQILKEAIAFECWSLAGFKGDFDEEPRTGPAAYGGILDLPNHPVVMVTWYEAVAFCRWLTERLREAGEFGSDQEVMLPTEAQWEKAARGDDGRIFPWGDEFDAAKCNVYDTGIGSTSAVGMFPAGASPYGVLDLSGNVWEWCRTKWQDDYQDYEDDNDLEGEVVRVLRGGAFYNDDLFVRCAIRYGRGPHGRSYDVGFRVVFLRQNSP